MATIKTAISIDEKLFKEAEKLSAKMKISRSQFFSRAVEEMLERKKNQKLLEMINDSVTELSSDEKKAMSLSLEQQKKFSEDNPW
jgi:metal-responsive CopG/Arc/MetJ family transcriptional regulator